MDPIGGINPSNPRLDNAAPQVGQPVVPSQQPTASSPITAPVLEAPIASAGPVVLSSNLNDFSETSSGGDAPSDKGAVAKKILLGLLGVIILLGLAGGGYFVGFSTGKSKGKTEADAEYQAKQAKAQQEQSPKEDISETDSSNAAELQLGDLKEPKYIDETIEGETGKQLSSSDGFVLKVVNIERNFKSTDTNYKLDSSKELVKVNFLIGNVTKDKPKDISSFNFRLENSVNAQLTPENIAQYTDKFDTVKLEPGGQAKGSIVYAVNKDEKPLKFVREQRYRISTENREVTTRVVVTVAK